MLITTGGTIIGSREFTGANWFTIYGVVIVDFENQVCYRPPMAIPIHVEPGKHICLSLS